MPKNTTIAHFVGNSVLGFIQFSETLDIAGKIVTLCASALSLILLAKQAFPKASIFNKAKPEAPADNKSE